MRCSTPFGITEYIGWRFHRGRPDSAISAQRLSASRNISAFIQTLKVVSRYVCSTPFGITEYIGPHNPVISRTLRIVLNAFRHHGIYRFFGLPGQVAAEMCSTPFGITEYIGRRPGAVRCGRCGVLNAFRHHGIYRMPRRAATSSLAVECSTPFGITEYIGLHAHQRALPEIPVLNAFRHHGIYRPTTYVKSMSMVGAQRLSASRNISGFAPCPSQ